MKYGNLKEALDTADALDEVLPPTLLPHGDALAFGQTYLTQADTHEMNGDWQWSKEEYQHNLNCLRQFIQDMDKIARMTCTT